MKDVKNRMTNPRDFRLDPNYVAPDQEKQKLLIKLAGMITDRYVAKYTHTIAPDDPEVWCLDEVLTKNEVKFMPDRAAASFAESRRDRGMRIVTGTSSESTRNV